MPLHNTAVEHFAKLRRVATATGKSIDEIKPDGELVFQVAFEASKSVPETAKRLEEFRNLYGLCRNMSFAGLVVALLFLGDGIFTDDPVDWKWVTAMFHMANDSDLFKTFGQFEAEGAHRDRVNWIDAQGAAWVPLYEAKTIHQFDHRWATYEGDGSESRDLSDDEKSDPLCEPLPRYWVAAAEMQDRLGRKSWVHPWLIAWRGITGVEKIRTVIASLIPLAAVGHSLFLLLPSKKIESPLLACLFSNLNCMVFDYVARTKIGGTNLNFFAMAQLPCLPPDSYRGDDVSFIAGKVLELVYTSETMRSFAEDLSYDGAPFGWNVNRRALLRAELDAYYAHLYGLSRDELRYVLDPADVYGQEYPSETFRVLKNSEIDKFGEYRTQRLVLDAWDRFERDGTFARRAAAE